MKYTVSDYLMNKKDGVWIGRPLDELRYLELVLENEVTYDRRKLDRRREVLRKRVNGEDIRYTMNIQNGGGIPQERRSEYHLRRAIEGIKMMLK